MAEHEERFRTHLCVCVAVEALEALQPDAGLGVQTGVPLVGRGQAEQPAHPRPQPPGAPTALGVAEGLVGPHVPHRGSRGRSEGAKPSPWSPLQSGRGRGG